MSASTRTKELIGKVGAMTRHHPEADTTELRRDLAEAHLIDLINDLAATAPPLTVEQCARVITALLDGGADDACT